MFSDRISILFSFVKNTLKPAAMVAKNGNILDMTAILKDLNQVKLKAVERYFDVNSYHYLPYELRLYTRS